MSKKRYGHGNVKTRRDREEKQQRRELIEAKQGIIDEGLNPNLEEIEKVDEPKSGKKEFKRPWYVLDTNLILSCVDVLYDPKDKDWRPPLNFYPNLDNAHLIIPEVVSEELNKIKDQYTAKSAVAGKALRRLKNFTMNSERTLSEIANLERPIRTGWKNQVISGLNIMDSFKESLPWRPKENDNDGWIAVTALVATMAYEGLPVDGSVPMADILKRSNKRRDVMLLTRDNDLLRKANDYAVRVRSYSFDERPPFTGRRDLVVPAEMFEKFYYEGKLSRREFEKYLPNEQSLVANEYIVMTPEGDKYPHGYFVPDTPFANVARYHKGNDMLYPMRFVKREGITPPNAGIATYYDALNDDKVQVIIASGDPGTGKTFTAITHAFRAIKSGKFLKLVIFVETEDNGVGFLPGNQDKKVAPVVGFVKDAIRSYLAKTPEFKKKREILREYGNVGFTNDSDDSRKRKKKDTEIKLELEDGKTYSELLDEQVNCYFKSNVEVVPFKQTESRTFEDAVILIDESQRIGIDLMKQLITRRGHNTLLIVSGDVGQNDHNSPEKRLKNGLVFTRMLYYNWAGCVNVYLTDNMRHEAVDIINRNYAKVMRKMCGIKV